LGWQFLHGHTPAGREEVAMKYCSECGKEVKEGIKFCGSCGGALKAKDAPVEKTVSETVNDIAKSPQVAAAAEKVAPAADKAKAIGTTALDFTKTPEAVVEIDIKNGALTNSLIFTAIAVITVIIAQLLFIRGVISRTASAVGGAVEGAAGGMFGGMDGGMFGGTLGGAAQSHTANAMSNVLPTGTIITVNLICAVIAILVFWLAGVLFSKISKTEQTAKQIFTIQGYATIPYIALTLVSILLIMLGGFGSFIGLIIMGLASMVFFFCYFALLSRGAAQVHLVASSVFAITVSLGQALVLFILFTVVGVSMAVNAASGLMGMFPF
jgi:hypothetical protein